MKTLRFILFLVLFGKVGFAQKTAPFRIDSLPTQGILLDRGWKFHAGDNPDFAKPDFDDAKWEGINPIFTIPDLKQVNTDNSLWLRIKLKSSKSQLIALSIRQSSASEIFLNGKIVKFLGTIGLDGQTTIAYTPVGEYVLLNLDATENTLAVRHFFQKGTRYKQFNDIFYPLFSCQVFDMNHIPKHLYNSTFIWEGFNIGVPFILFLVYFTIFLFYKPNKTALWFSLWGLSNAIVSFFVLQAKFTPEIAIQNQYTFWGPCFSSFATICLLYSIFLLLHQKRNTFLAIFIGFSILNTIYYFLNSSENERIVDFLVLLGFIGIIVYISINAIKQGESGGIYVIIGLIFFVVFWAIFLFDLIGFEKSTAVAGIIYHIATLSLPVIIATLLGLEFKNTNLSLLKNIDEIKILSTEKQRILATQNETLEKQVAQRTAELRASQNQLIQKEKLASLGELTAGIAHEIQNPLNFVNNFSELSVDLAQEINEEIQKSELDKDYIQELMGDLSQNQEKINHHGKRAASIVRGMLEHSRPSSGEPTLTDLNTLCDEYLRLSYQGMRAKDKSFNADYELIADPDLPRIKVVPGDLGRVLLNIINNAFQARSPHRALRVAVSTEHTTNEVVVNVQDNGTGISDAVKAKIFQPFFTTKPTGEGTGLGLSLAYDIVTKGHGGTLECESVEGAGTTFVVKLPILA